MKEYPYRISEAALGKIYAELISLTRNAEIPAEQLHATMCAVFSYIESEREPAPDDGIDPSVWERFKARIDRSARLSASARARARAARRRNPCPVPSPAPAPAAAETAPATVSADCPPASTPVNCGGLPHPGLLRNGRHKKAKNHRQIKMVAAPTPRNGSRNRRRNLAAVKKRLAYLPF